MTKSLILVSVFALLLLAGSVSALQQTVGSLSMNVSAGDNASTKYGLMNDANDTIIVKLNAVGEASKYLEYPKELKLKPNQFTYVEVSCDIPENYSGAKQINGTIYALIEGEKGQVQVNMRLGKNIRLNISDKKNNLSDIITVMCVIMIMIALIYISKKVKI